MLPRYLPLLLIAVSFLVAGSLDFVMWPGQRSIILFVLPLAIASRYAGRRGVIIVAVASVLLGGLSAVQTPAPPALSAVRMLALMLIALLAVWVAQSREAYSQRVEELEQTREQLRQFMGLVVHDLRNPLGVALGYVQFARRKLAGIPADTVEGSLASAEKSLHTMEHLLSDLLDAVRLGNNRFQIHPAPFDLAALVRSAVDDQGRIYPRHKIVLDSPDHVEVAGDEDRIRQVVVNLISNACKYSAEETEVGVRVRAQADTVTLTVEDDGRGIAPADLGEIFQPFARLAIDRAVPGVGLGLYITKGIVEAHGGTITVSSIIGQGSVFIVTLPQHNVGLLASSTDVASPSRETYKRQ